MEQGFYDDAVVYDVLHTPGTAREVTGLERIERRFGSGRLGGRDRVGVWLEPACGSGRYLRVAGRRGRAVVGFDRDAGMVAYARRRLEGVGGRAAVFEAEMADFAAGMPAWARGRVSLAFNTINTIRHLGSDGEVRAHLAEIERVLGPGGIYAVGLSTAGPLEQETEDVWHARRGGMGVTQVVQYEPAAEGTRDERVTSHITVTTAGGERHIDSRYTLRAYSVAQWMRLVGSSALRLMAAVDEDGDELVPPESGYALYVLGR